jgi:phage shock protein A
MLMTSERLAQIEERARLFAEQADPAALRPEDVGDMLAEIREARQAVAHLIATTRRHHLGTRLSVVLP